MNEAALGSATNTIRIWLVRKRVNGRSIDHTEIVAEVMRRWPDTSVVDAVAIAQGADAGAQQRQNDKPQFYQ